MIPVFDILLISLVLIILAVFLAFWSGRKFSARLIWLSLFLAVLLTFLSLFVKNEGYSGTGWRVQRGFPHFFYITWQSMESSESFRNFTLGSFGIYVISNILFYFPIIYLAITSYFAFIGGKRGEKAKVAKT